MSNSAANLYTPASKMFCESSLESGALCEGAALFDPSTPRPYPALATCNASDVAQQWVESLLFPGSVCPAADSDNCFNVAKQRNGQVILFPTSAGAKGQANEVFTLSGTALKTSGGSQCITANQTGELFAGACTNEAGTWALDASSKAIKHTAANGAETCVKASESKMITPRGLVLLRCFKMARPANNLDLRCVLRPSPKGAGCKTSRIQELQ